MINTFEEEFLRIFADIAGYQMPSSAVDELVNYFPEIYGGLTAKDWKRGDIIHKACRDYLGIIKGYMIFYRMPITIESLTAAYEWGITDLRERGIEKSPSKIKRYIAKIKHQLQPQYEMIEAEYMSKG